MSRTKRILFLTLIGLVLAQASIGLMIVKAAHLTHDYPQKFVRIFSDKELTDETYYLLGGLGVNHRFSLMQTNSQGNGVNGKYVGNGVPSIQEASSERTVWMIKRTTNNRVIIQSIDTEQYLYTPKSNKTDLEFTEKNNKEWILQENGNGTFSFINLQDSERGIGISDYTDKVYFGNYKTTACDSRELYLFKLADATHVPGEATQPQDGEQVILWCNHQVVSNSPNGFVLKDENDYLLNNQTFAPDSTLSIWTCRLLSENHFLLHDSQQQSLFQHLNIAEDISLKVENGYICTTEEQPRFLAMNKDGHLLLSDSLQVENEVPVITRSVADPPTLQFEDGYKLILQGGWSAQQLADLNWDSVGILDLTQISLPVQKQAFKNRGPHSNALIYIEERDATVCPDSWPFVVVCKSTGENHLIRHSVLHDRTPFYVDQPFQIEKGMLSYQRKCFTDDGWETICLPFNTTWPTDFESETCSEFDGQNISFVKTHTLEAYQPQIFRYTGEKTEGKAILTLVADAGEITPNKNSEGYLIGTFDTLNVNQPSPTIFLLNTNGDKFVRADKGSRLMPFRAFLTTATTHSALHIIHEATTHVQPLNNEQEAKPCYTIQGTYIGTFNQQQLQHQPKGLYIIGNKKTIN